MAEKIVDAQIEETPHKIEDEDGTWFDYTTAKNETAAKNQARADLTQLFLEFLTERFAKRGTVAKVGKNEIAFAFGDVIDKYGYSVCMVATVKPVIKCYQAHDGENRPTEAYDIDQKAQDFLDGVES